MARDLAVITGASSGLGVEFARLLAADGYDVALVARSRERLEALAAELSAAHGIVARPIAADLSIAAGVDAVLAAVPACDVLINNAGFGSHGAFATISPERLASEIGVDVLALTLLTRRYLPGMLERKRGRVLNVASTAGFVPGPLMAVYYASKAYVISFSEALWDETRGTGVSVSVLCPGATATEFGARAGMKRTLLMRLPLANAADVARAGYRAMLRGKRMEVPGIMNKLVAISPRFGPKRLVLWLSRKAVES